MSETANQPASPAALELAMVELTREGLSHDLKTIPTTWALQMFALDEHGPAAYPRNDLAKATLVADQVLLISKGEGFVAGQRVRGEDAQFQADALLAAYRVLSARKRCLLVCTNPSLLGEWRVAFKLIAPHIPLTEWPPVAIAA